MLTEGVGGRQPLLLDVRNSYEWDAGHFEGAQRPLEVGPIPWKGGVGGGGQAWECPERSIQAVLSAFGWAASTAKHASLAQPPFVKVAETAPPSAFPPPCTTAGQLPRNAYRGAAPAAAAVPGGQALPAAACCHLLRHLCVPCVFLACLAPANFLLRELYPTCMPCSSSRGEAGLSVSPRPCPLCACQQGADPDTPVMIYCTGGIRCDVYGTYLRKKG